MKHMLVALFFFLALSAHSAFVEIHSVFQDMTRVQEVVGPAQFKLVPFGVLRRGDELAVQVDVSSKPFNDITACFLTESEARAYSSQTPCRGQVRGRAPITMRYQVSSDGAHFLVLDNSYAAVFKKNLTVSIATRRNLSSDEQEAFRSGFQKVQAMMASTFDSADLNVIVKPCGQSNAFSDRQSAAITLCTELISDLGRQRSGGAIIAVLFHEYGHSLLNKWGEPGSSEEDMADQFSVAMLLRTGDDGRRLLEQWIGYWLRQDSRAEAEMQLQRGSTHTLSVQRARNIQNWMNAPDEHLRRWNKMLYRHMTRGALESITSKPGRADDLDLAQEALRSR